jgi:hypothetical protein
MLPGLNNYTLLGSEEEAKQKQYKALTFLVDGTADLLIHRSSWQGVAFEKQLLSLKMLKAHFQFS